MYLINIHEDLKTSLNVQNLTTCKNNLRCFNNVAFFKVLLFKQTFFNKEIREIANLSLLNHKFELNLNQIKNSI